MERILLILDGGQLRVEEDWKKYLPLEKQKKKNGESVKDEEKEVSTFYHSASTVCGKYTVVDMDKTSAQPIVRSLLRQISVLPEIDMLRWLQIGQVITWVILTITLFASMSDNQWGLDKAEKAIIDKVDTLSGALSKRGNQIQIPVIEEPPRTSTGETVKNPFKK